MCFLARSRQHTLSCGAGCADGKHPDVVPWKCRAFCVCVAEEMHGHFTGSAVILRDGSELLHPWLQGWYGELVFEASWAPRLPHEPAEDASSGAPKVLHLSLTEAFFLAFLILDTSLRLSVESSCGPSSAPLSESEAWLAFSAAQPRFAHNLAAFCALRQAGWCVRCGLKYGADFALYAADGEFAAPAAPPPRRPPHHRAACTPTLGSRAPPSDR